MSVSALNVATLLDWLGPEGAVAGLDKSDLTNADLMMIARREGVAIETRASRKQLTIEIVMVRVKRIDKEPEHLIELSRDELKRYLSERMVSNFEMLELLRRLSIAPSRKIRGRLIDFAANEISDLGMYSRVAKGRGFRELDVSERASNLPKKKEV